MKKNTEFYSEITECLGESHIIELHGGHIMLSLNSKMVTAVQFYNYVYNLIFDKFLWIAWTIVTNKKKMLFTG